MSEELEWELYDVFDSGLFAFPLYEHQTARKIVRYLIYRGVLEEEIADAIEDSTIDLHVWLNRQGKNMVGEWVIAWVNDVRDEYLAEKERDPSENGYELRDTVSRDRGLADSLGNGDDGDDDTPDGGGGGGGGAQRRGGMNRRQIRPQDSQSISSEGSSDFDDETEVKRPLTPPPLPPRGTLKMRRDQVTRRFSDEIMHLRHIDSSSAESSLHRSDHEHENEHQNGNREREVPFDRFRHQLQVEVHHDRLFPREDDTVMDPTHQLTFDQNRRCSLDLYERTPDSGAVSDIYSTIPHDLAMYNDECNGSVPMACSITCISTTPTTTHCSTHGTKHILTQAGTKICPNCTCTLAHYALLNKPNISVCSTPTSSNSNQTQNNRILQIQQQNNQQKPPQPNNIHQNQNGGCRPLTPITIDTTSAPTSPTSPTSPTPTTSTDSAHSSNSIDCQRNSADFTNIYSESTIRAMELHIDTLDKDGPGYVFIMTDSLENCLPWSSEHRYKVGASRRPERFVTEFRAMNISIELIWQVRVDHHMKAVKEIHSHLDKYNLHTNWFKCSLSLIMDTISRTVRKYRAT